MTYSVAPRFVQKEICAAGFGSLRVWESRLHVFETRCLFEVIVEISTIPLCYFSGLKMVKGFYSYVVGNNAAVE